MASTCIGWRDIFSSGHNENSTLEGTKAYAEIQTRFQPNPQNRVLNQNNSFILIMRAASKSWAGHHTTTSSPPIPRKSPDSVNTHGAWSDPQAFASTMNGSSREDGVDVPPFLQPILGVDFVPYMPNQFQTSSIEAGHANGNSRTRLGMEGKEGENDAIRKSLISKQTLVRNGDLQEEDDIDAIFVKAMSSKKNIKAGVLKRIRRKLKKQSRESPRNVAKKPALDVIIPNPEETLTDDLMRDLGLQGSWSDYIDSDTNSLVAESPTPEIPDDAKATPTNPIENKGGGKESFKLSPRIPRPRTLSGTPKLAGTPTSTPKGRKRFWSYNRSSSNTLSELGSIISLDDSNRSPTIVSDTNTSEKKEDIPDNTVGWIKTQRSTMNNHQIELKQVLEQVKVMQGKTLEIYKRIDSVQGEIALLQKALKKSEKKLRRDLDDFEAANSELTRLQEIAQKASEGVLDSIRQIQRGPLQKRNSSSKLSGLEKDASEPDQNKLMNTGSFMRSHDFKLDLIDSASQRALSISSSISSNSEITGSDFVLVDDNLSTIVKNLVEIGYTYVTDESEEFVATRDTERILESYVNNPIVDDSVQDFWPLKPWLASRNDDVLVWLGNTKAGHGSNVPVCKARGRINLPPRALVDFLLDSSRIREYNAMSQGREDLLMIQESLDTTAEESKFGIPGMCKIIRSKNKPKLLPKVVEMTSLMYAKPLKSLPGSYLVVNRSIHKDATGELKSTKDTMITEMLLGANLIRPVGEDGQMSEFSTITHAFAPGVPAMLARKAAPGSATNMIKEIQKLFDTEKNTE